MSCSLNLTHKSMTQEDIAASAVRLNRPTRTIVVDLPPLLPPKPISEEEATTLVSRLCYTDQATKTEKMEAITEAVMAPYEQSRQHPAPLDPEGLSAMVQRLGGTDGVKSKAQKVAKLRKELLKEVTSPTEPLEKATQEALNQRVYKDSMEHKRKATEALMKQYCPPLIPAKKKKKAPNATPSAPKQDTPATA